MYEYVMSCGVSFILLPDALLPLQIKLYGSDRTSEILAERLVILKFQSDLIKF